MNLCLFINGHYPPYPHGGVGSFAVDLAEGVVKRGHQVTCISLYQQQVLQSEKPIFEFRNEVRLVRIPKPFADFPNRLRIVLEKIYLAKLVSKLHQQDPFDIIEGEDGCGMLALGSLPQVPKVVRLHATSIYNDFVLNRKPSRLNHLFENLWINRADHIIAVSDFVGETTMSLLKLGNREKSYEVIHYAIDTDLFKPIPSIKSEAGLIVFTGVVAPRKGVLELLKAMNIVFSKNNSAKLLVVGDDQYTHNGKPYKDQIIPYLDKKYRHRVKFTGNKNRDQLPSLIQKAEVCCFPSHVETFGIGIVEAMAMEKPVIYMQAGPGPEVIEERVSGVLCDTSDPEDIAEKILYLLDHPDIAKDISVNARKRVLSRFEKKKWIEKNLQFYAHCLARS